jgi:hypothetical protein
MKMAAAAAIFIGHCPAKSVKMPVMSSFFAELLPASGTLPRWRP